MIFWYIKMIWNEVLERYDILILKMFWNEVLERYDILILKMFWNGVLKDMIFW